MPCMCGDLQCPSCGPAQGNHKCPACGRWSDEGCEDPQKCNSEAAEIAQGEFEFFLEESILEGMASLEGLHVFQWGDYDLWLKHIRAMPLNVRELLNRCLRTANG